MISYPLISIITVVYNGAKTLEQTIHSVINQTYNNIEYIIVDGGSDDATVDIIKKYDNQIALWVSESDKGLYHAMNKGILMAKGEIIGMINSDDWYEINAVALMVDAYQKYPKKRIFHGDRYDIKNNGTKTIRKFNPSSFKFLYYGMTYNHPSMFVHRDIYNKDLYNINLTSMSDYEFVLAQYLTHKESFHYIPTAYVNYRLDGVSGQLKFTKSLAEGFMARKNAGLSLIKNCISLTLRFIVKLIFKTI